MRQKGGVFTLLLIAVLAVFAFFVLIALMGFSPVANTLARCGEQAFSKMQRATEGENSDITIEQLCVNVQKQIEDFNKCEKTAVKDLVIPVPEPVKLIDWYTKQSIPDFKQLSDYTAFYDSKCSGVKIYE